MQHFHDVTKQLWRYTELLQQKYGAVSDDKQFLLFTDALIRLQQSIQVSASELSDITGAVPKLMQLFSEVKHKFVKNGKSLSISCVALRVRCVLFHCLPELTYFPQFCDVRAGCDSCCSLCICVSRHSE